MPCFCFTPFASFSRLSFAFCFFFFAPSGNAFQSHVVGAMPNMLLEAGEAVIVVNSGDRSRKNSGVAVIKEGVVKNYPLPDESNPYRGAVVGKRLLVSANLSDELFSFPLENLKRQDEKADFVMLHQPDLESTGAESLAAGTEQLFWAFTNLVENWNFDRGALLVFDRAQLPDAKKLDPVARVELSAKNPKTLKALSSGRIAVVTGEYGKDDGKLHILSPGGRLVGKLKQSELNARGEWKELEIGGTPGPIVESEDGLLWSCDLESNKLYRMDAQKASVDVLTLPFKACSDLEMTEAHLFVSSLYGGWEGNPKEHLYVFERPRDQDLSLQCARVLSEDQSKRFPAWVSDLMLSEDQDSLWISAGGINRVFEVKVDAEAGLELCRP